MARPITLTWPATSSTAIAAVQDVSAGDFVVMNGPLAYKGPSGQESPVITFFGIVRTVSVSSPDDLSTLDVIVVGELNGQVVSQEITGPNTSTVYTTQLFDKVTSVKVIGDDATNLSIGTGTTGRTKWVIYNYHATVANLSIEAIVSGTINYSFKTTLDDIETNSSPTTFTPITALTAATTSQLANYTATTRYYNITVNTATNGALTITFLQQGIT